MKKIPSMVNCGLTVLGMLSFTVSSAATVPYNAVDVTVNASQAEGTLSVSPKASPVLGVKNPVVRGGTAFVGMTKDMGEYNTVLGTKLPAALHLNLQQGSFNGQLVGLPLRRLDLKTEQSGVTLALPSSNVRGALNTQQGSVTFNLPKNVGIRLHLKKFNMGSLTISGKKIVDGLDSEGTFSSVNYESAQYKVELDITSEQTEIVVNFR